MQTPKKTGTSDIPVHSVNLTNSWSYRRITLFVVGSGILVAIAIVATISATHSTFLGKGFSKWKIIALASAGGMGMALIGAAIGLHFYSPQPKPSEAPQQQPVTPTQPSEAPQQPFKLTRREFPPGYNTKDHQDRVAFAVFVKRVCCAKSVSGVPKDKRADFFLNHPAPQTKDASLARTSYVVDEMCLSDLQLVSQILCEPKNTTESYALAVFYGNMIGDAIGACYEFQPWNPSGYPNLELKPDNFRFGRTIPYDGQWTDDASMARAMAEYFLWAQDNKQLLCGPGLMHAFFAWWRCGYQNSSVQGTLLGSVGLGGNTGQAMKDFKTIPFDQAYRTLTKSESIEGIQCSCPDLTASGNGSLMRNSPVPLIAKDLNEAKLLGYQQSLVTHGGEMAACMASLHAQLIWMAIHSNDLGNPTKVKEQWWTFLNNSWGITGLSPKELQTARGWDQTIYEQQVEEISTFHAEIREQIYGPKAPWRDDRFLMGCFQVAETKARILYDSGKIPEAHVPTPEYFGAYALHALQIALHCIYTTNTFQGAVEKSIERGGDADTLGAITATLAASLYGLQGIPMDWIGPVLHIDCGVGGVMALRLLKPPRQTTT